MTIEKLDEAKKLTDIIIHIKHQIALWENADSIGINMNSKNHYGAYGHYTIDTSLIEIDTWRQLTIQRLKHLLISYQSQFDNL